MSKKLSRRDFLKMTGVTSAGLILSACGVKASELPIATSLPSTNTPFPTSTLTPLPPTLAPTPTVEDLKMNGIVQKTIGKLVAEFNKKGNSVTKEELLQNGLKVVRINGVDENSMAKNYDVVVTVSTQSGEGGGYPVAMIEENNIIKKININSILGMIGINYILTAAWDEKNKAAWDEWLKEGDIFEPDSADTMKGMDIYGYSKSTEHFTDSQGLEFLNAYLRRAQKNHQGLKFNAVFYGNDVVAECIKGETDPAKVEAFMRERLATLLRFKPSEMNVVIEPFDLIDGKLKWGVYPWYTVWGEEWPIKAFQFAREEAEKQGLIPGKDIMFYWCDWKLDQPSLQLDKTLEIIDKIKLNGDHIDGVGIEILLGENVRWYPHVPQKNEIMEVMHSVLEHVPHIFIDYETWHNSASSPKIVSIAVEVFKACVEINRERPDSVISFNVWDDYNPESPLDPKSFAFYYKVTYEPNLNYYDLEKEMIRILA